MNNKGGGFGNGLLVGIILGSVLTLLFTTKKGREILRTMSEEGLDKVKDLEHVLDSVEMDDEEEEENVYVDPEERAELKKTTVARAPNGTSNGHSKPHRFSVKK